VSPLVEAVAAARVYDLEQPRTARSPIHPAHVPPGYAYLLHRRHEPGPEARTGAAGVLVTSEHAGTHIDALSHQGENMRLHGGVEVTHAIQTSTGFREHGAENIAPLVGRGVMVDLAPGGRVEPGRWIGLEEVRRACAEQGVEPRRGDVFLARTGNGALWSEPDEYLRGSGMAGEVSQWLADAGVRAVGADNVAWDWTGGSDPLTGTTLPGHVILLVRCGIHILENLNLEALAAAGVREFAFVCLPLKLVGATGSPVRPIALA
jgi:kynurenine formamidase